MVIGGRRWRAADPHIPDSFRQELVNELMAARRAVRDAASARDIRLARRRVHDAKVALGERGRAWWLAPAPGARNRRIEAATLALLRSRGPGRSICPSDIARIAGGATWRTLLPIVRERAVVMAARGAIDVLRRGRIARSRLTEGVLRYRLPRTGNGPAGRVRRARSG